LDVEMNGITGIEAGQEIRQIDSNVIFIFITNHTEYVYESFTVEPFDYIVKPFNADSIGKTLSRALKKYREQHHLIDYKWQGNLYTLDINRVVSIEAFRGRIFFHTLNEKDEYECNGNLDNYEHNLQAYGFLRSHRNVLVNMRHIKSIEDRKIKTNCGKTVQMSVRKKQSCLRAYSSYLTKYRV
jgi:DNA-binding LytR/AlgR family response regulator